MVQEVLKAKEKLNNINPTILNMPTTKPLDEELLLKTAQTPVD